MLSSSCASPRGREHSGSARSRTHAPGSSYGPKAKRPRVAKGSGRDIFGRLRPVGALASSRGPQNNVSG
eukprot:1636536-Pyramimonas_sp.AAC.1